jgi:hypothetical protein
MGMASLSDGAVEYVFYVPKPHCFADTLCFIRYMIHRRLLHDDKFGVTGWSRSAPLRHPSFFLNLSFTEPLDETQAVTWDMLPLRLGPGMVVSGSVRLLLGGSGDDAPMRQQMSTLFNPPLLMISKTFDDTAKLADRSFLANELPQNIGIMTFQPVDEDHVLLRLAHLHAVGETLGLPANVSLPNLFIPGESDFFSRTSHN